MGFRTFLPKTEIKATQRFARLMRCLYKHGGTVRFHAGSMFFINGLLLPGPITGGRPELPLLVSVQYYGLGFIMFLAGGIAALVKSQRDALAIVTGTAAVLVAIALFLHVIYNVRNS